MKTPDVIYLIPDDEYGYVWCEDPAPGMGMEERDAVKYVRVGTNKESSAKKTAEELDATLDAGEPMTKNQRQVVEDVCCGTKPDDLCDICLAPLDEHEKAKKLCRRCQ